MCIEKKSTQKSILEVDTRDIFNIIDDLVHAAKSDHEQWSANKSGLQDIQDDGDLVKRYITRLEDRLGEI